MAYLNAKPTDSKEDLLRDIVTAAQQAHMPGLPLRPFAALLVKVGDETDETIADLKALIVHLDQKNSKLQFWVVALAVAALLASIAQIAVAVMSLPPASASSNSRSLSLAGAAVAPQTASDPAQNLAIKPNAAASAEVAVKSK